MTSLSCKLKQVPVHTCVVRLGAITDWWHNWPVANTLACMWSC